MNSIFTIKESLVFCLHIDICYAATLCSFLKLKRWNSRIRIVIVVIDIAVSHCLRSFRLPFRGRREMIFLRGVRWTLLCFRRAPDYGQIHPCVFNFVYTYLDFPSVIVIFVIYIIYNIPHTSRVYCDRTLAMSCLYEILSHLFTLLSIFAINKCYLLSLSSPFCLKY